MVGVKGRGLPRILPGYSRDSSPNSYPFPAPSPWSRATRPPHLSRRALQGVAVQQNDLQVPEAAEGDRDAGDTVTGEIQADKRKIPQLWGWVREESGACPRVGPCVHFLCPLLWPTRHPWGHHVLWPGWLAEGVPREQPPCSSSCLNRAHLQASPAPSSCPAHGLLSPLPPPDPPHTPAIPSSLTDRPKTQTATLHMVKNHDLQPRLLRVSGP